MSIRALREEQAQLAKQVSAPPSSPPLARVSRRSRAVLSAPPAAQLAHAKQQLDEVRHQGTMRSARPDSRGRASREELHRVDKEAARLKREVSRMRVQLDSAVHDEKVTRLHNLVAEKAKEHEALAVENRLLERQLAQLQPQHEEEEAEDQRAIEEEHAQLTSRMKKYQKLSRIDDQRRQKLQKEYSKASVRTDRLRRELKLEQVRHPAIASASSQHSQGSGFLGARSSARRSRPHCDSRPALVHSPAPARAGAREAHGTARVCGLPRSARGHGRRRGDGRRAGGANGAREEALTRAQGTLG
jgi:hypothetical protein